MASKSAFSSIWVRIAVFLWAVVFPLVFIAIPLAEFLTGEGSGTSVPVWALVVWFLAPAVVSMGMKYLGGSKAAAAEETDTGV